MLENFIGEEHISQRLIVTQSRGGLTAVKSEIQKIFQLAERMFRVDTSASTVFRIDTKTIMHGLLMNTEMGSLFNSLIENSGVAIDSEVKDNLLENRLKLYLRVRRFSYARDKINKHVFALKKKKKQSTAKRHKKGNGQIYYRLKSDYILQINTNTLTLFLKFLSDVINFGH